VLAGGRLRLMKGSACTTWPGKLMIVSSACSDPSVQNKFVLLVSSAQTVGGRRIPFQDSVCPVVMGSGLELKSSSNNKHLQPGGGIALVFK
jgi:hypothetical protein